MTAEAVFLDGGVLGVRFWRLADRYAHAICLSDGSTWHEVVHSIEGTPSDAWPSSPPLQMLHTQREPDGRQLALLVGMAGKSHWSASIELDAAAETIRFEFACRLSAGQVGPLGNNYHAIRPAAIVDSRRLMWAGAGGPLALGIDDRFERAQLAVSGETIRIGLATCGDEAAARTVRWGYAIAPKRA